MRGIAVWHIQRQEVSYVEFSSQVHRLCEWQHATVCSSQLEWTAKALGSTRHHCRKWSIPTRRCNLPPRIILNHNSSGSSLYSNAAALYSALHITARRGRVARELERDVYSR